MTGSITEFIGHLHPVIVHLPIGILLLGCLFLWQSRMDKYARLQPAINGILFWGMISAIVSCITGFILSKSGDYDEGTIQWHQWMGISVAIVSIITYCFRRSLTLQKWQWIMASLLLLLIFVTGHLGGSLTHGADYLTGPLQNLSGNDTIALVKRKPIPDIQNAIIYPDLVQPVFQAKCYNCHGSTKQKGKLRLDESDMIMKGGKDGVVIIPGKANESELIKRILLPREDEHHMPPKEKPALTEKEINLLQWWVSSGAGFTQKVKDIPQPEKIKSMLVSFQLDTAEIKNLAAIPAEPVSKADEVAIKKLTDKGIVVTPVAQNSNYLAANFITAPASNDQDMQLLLPLQKQLVWLKLGNTKISDSCLPVISRLVHLTQLQLDHTAISDKEIGLLQSLDKLQTLNLVGTKITAAGVMKLASLKNLHSIYLYQSLVSKEDWQKLQKAFPKTEIDSGGYRLPYIEADTMIVKEPVHK